MVSFSGSTALLQSIANTLATEATAAGLAALSSSLTGFAGDLGQGLTADEFFGGGETITETTGIPPVTTTTTTKTDSAGLVWAQTLMAAAAAIKTKIHNDIKTDVDAIKTSIDIIQDDISRIRDLGDREEDGLGFRTVQPYAELSIGILWLLYIERGKILELNLDSIKINELLTQNQNIAGSAELRQASIQRLNQIIDLIKNSGFRSFNDV